MTTIKFRTIMMLLGISFHLVACSSEHSNHQPNEGLSPQNISDSAKVVTIVRVKAPWYAFDFILNKKLRDAVPEYQRVRGLQFKAFSSIKTSEGKFFGGIYLWENKSKAQSWFAPQWFINVKKKRGAEGKVAYFEVMTDSSWVEKTYDYRKNEDKAVTIFVHEINVAQFNAQQEGVLRYYLVKEPNEKAGALLIFADATKAKAFIKTQKVVNYEWFSTPVLLNNVP